jgi:hypothetical protein
MGHFEDELQEHEVQLHLIRNTAHNRACAAHLVPPRGGVGNSQRSPITSEEENTRCQRIVGETSRMIQFSPGY